MEYFSDHFAPNFCRQKYEKKHITIPLLAEFVQNITDAQVSAAIFEKKKSVTVNIVFQDSWEIDNFIIQELIDEMVLRFTQIEIPFGSGWKVITIDNLMETCINFITGFRFNIVLT